MNKETMKEERKEKIENWKRKKERKKIYTRRKWIEKRKKERKKPEFNQQRNNEGRKERRK